MICTMNKLSPEVIQAMREWLAECLWADADEADIMQASEAHVVRAVAKTYDGGLAGFLLSR